MVKFGFQVLQFLLLGGISIYVYLSNRDKVTNARITEMETGIDARLDIHVERIAKLEAQSDKALTHVDIGVLHEKINNVRADVSSIAGELKGISDNQKLILTQITQKGMQ